MAAPAKPFDQWTIDDYIADMKAEKIADTVKSIYQQESSSGKADTSKPNSQGIRGPMQVGESAFQDVINAGYLPKTAKREVDSDNIRAGIAYLLEASRKHNTTDPRILAAYYHGGPNAVRNAQLVQDRMKLSDSLGKTTGSYVEDVASRAGAGQAPVQAAPKPQSAPDDKTFYSAAVEKIKAARAAGNAEIERRIRELVDQYAIMRGHKTKEQEENGD